MSVICRALLVGAWLLLCRDALAVTWSLPHSGADGGELALELNAFAGSLAAGNGLSLTPEAGSDARRSLDRVMKGEVPIAAVPLALIAPDNPVLAMDRVPFLAGNAVDGAKLWQVVQPEVERELAGRGLSLMYAVPAVPVALLSMSPIATLKDLAGARILVDAPPLADLVARTRAVTAPPGAPAAALGGGSADIAFVSAAQAVADEAWRYARYYLHAPAWFPKQLVVVNRGALTALPRGARDALLNAADASRAGAWQRMQQVTEERVQNLRDRGIRVRQPPVALSIALEDLGRELLFDWSDNAGEVGAELVESYYRVK